MTKRYKNEEEIQQEVHEIMGYGAYEGTCQVCSTYTIELGDEKVCKTCARSAVDPYTLICKECTQKLETNQKAECRVCYSILRSDETSICKPCLIKKAQGICPKCGNTGKLMGGDGLCIDCIAE